MRWTPWILALGLVSCAGDGSKTDDTGATGDDDDTTGDDDDTTGDDDDVTGDDDDTTGDDDDDDTTADGFDPVGTWDVLTVRNVEGSTTDSGVYTNTGYTTYSYGGVTGQLVVEIRADGSWRYTQYYTGYTDTSASAYYGNWSWQQKTGDVARLDYDIGYSSFYWLCESDPPYDAMSCVMWVPQPNETGDLRYSELEMVRL